MFPSKPKKVRESSKRPARPGCSMGAKECSAICSHCKFYERPSFSAMIGRVHIAGYNADLAHRGEARMMAAAFLKALEAR